MGRGFLELNLSSIYEPEPETTLFTFCSSSPLGVERISILYLLHCICCIISAALYLLHGWAVHSMR